MNRKRKTVIGMSLLLLTLFLVGCKSDTLDDRKIKNIDYTVTSEDRLPEELKVLIDGKKQQPFKMTYQDGDSLFICQGYGTQPSGGYSIQVKDVYRTSNAIYFSAVLIGPSQEEREQKKETTPYIVVKTEYQDMTVVFD